MASNWRTYTIASGQTAGPEWDLSLNRGPNQPTIEILAIHFPSTFDGAAVSVRAAIPGGSFVPCVDSAGTALTLTPGAVDRIVLIGSGILQGIPRFQLVAGTSQSGTDTDLSILLSDDIE